MYEDDQTEQMNTTLSEIFERFRDAGVVDRMVGTDKTITGFAGIEAYGGGDLVFVDDESLIDRIAKSPPAAVLTNEELAAALSGAAGLGVLIGGNVRLAYALIRQAYDDYDPRLGEWPRVHPSAVIHESVNVPDDAVIGPGAVIGRNVQLGRRTVIQANSVIEHDTVIGDDTIVHARVFIGRGCRIGARVRLKPGCVIGADGFGFVRDDANHYHRVPQKGIVVIEDDVLISANCTVDRATYSETRIARGCKLDALCHVGHNVFLDEDCLLVAQTGIAGSSRFGKRVIASGQTGVLDHKNITDDVVLVHRCGISEDITEPGVYASGPAQPFHEYTRNIAVFQKLYELRKRVLRMERQLKRLLGDKAG